jgi:AcrR family transcriptional regulator
MAGARTARASAPPAAEVDPERTSYPAAARRLLRDMLLDAARGLLADRHWPEVTMAEVARAAGVSRQTLYNEFRSRDEFAQAFVLREEARLLAAVEAVIRAHLDDPAQALQDAFGVFLTAAAHDPLVRRFLSEDGADGMLPLVTTRGRPVVEGAVARLEEIVISCWPHVQRVHVSLLAECIVRLAISYAILPAGKATMTAASVVTLLGPYLERAFATDC